MIRKKKKERNSGLIIGFLNFISAAIMNALCSGFLGKIFTSYDKIEKKARKSLFLGMLTREPEGREKSIRRRLLKYFDESLVMRAVKRTVGFFRSCKLNFYGTFFSTFGAYSVVITLIKASLSDGGITADVFTETAFWGAIIVFLASLPLLASKKSVISLVAESVTMRTLFEDGLGVPEGKFSDTPTKKRRGAYFAAVIAGMLASGATYFVTPLTVIGVIAFVVAVCLFMSFPEIGVIVTVFVAPFLGFVERPSTILAVLVGITAFSYFLKFIVGKRAFSVRLADVMVIFLGALLLFGGIITSGGSKSTSAAIMYTVLILGYFLVVNLMNTKEWLDRCIAAVAIPSGIIAAIGILGYATVSMPAKWIDTEMFADIGSRAVSTFDNPNMLATYLLMTAPFIWVYLRRREISVSGRIIALVGGAASVTCMVLTWSRGGWLGMITAALIFLLINYRYVLKYFIVAGLLSPVWVMLLPNNVINPFTSIGNLADSSTYYRIYTWKGTLKLLAEHFVGGIGVGHSAFSQIYPLYAYVGTEITMHSHNLFLELAVEIGIMGLLVFLIAVFMISQRGFGCIKHHSSDRSAVTAVSAAIAGIAGALVHGMVDHIWYNYRVFFMFWIVAAIVCAFANVYPKRSRDSEYHSKGNVENEASLDIIFGQKNEA